MYNGITMIKKGVLEYEVYALCQGDRPPAGFLQRLP